MFGVEITAQGWELKKAGDKSYLATNNPNMKIK